jgi:hypothetical protein
MLAAHSPLRYATAMPKDAIAAFHGLEEVALYFVRCAFEEISIAFRDGLADRLFAQKIDGIDAPENWSVPALPSDLETWLEANIEVLPEETIDAFSNAFDKSHEEAATTELRLAPQDRISSIALVGHVINLAAFVESFMNRQLFYMSETGQLEPDFYKALDRTEAIPKLLFVYKSQIEAKTLSPSRITQLFRLRNKAVHSKAGDREGLTVTVEDLLGIWKAVSQLLDYGKGQPTREDFDDLTSAVSKRWLIQATK